MRRNFDDQLDTAAYENPCAIFPQPSRTSPRILSATSGVNFYFPSYGGPTRKNHFCLAVTAQKVAAR